mgnify:CR=1 FL=1|jgi:hypothetical protein
MKTILLILGTLLIVVALIGTDFRHSDQAAVEVEKKKCYGYTIIEFGKGINCNGDTVRLIQVPGGQQRALVE